MENVRCAMFLLNVLVSCEHITHLDKFVAAFLAKGIGPLPDMDSKIEQGRPFRDVPGEHHAPLLQIRRSLKRAVEEGDAAIAVQHDIVEDVVGAQVRA